MITEPELRDALLQQAETYTVPPPDLTSLRAVAERRRRDTRLRYGGIGVVVLLIGVGMAWGLLRLGQGGLQPADSVLDGTASPSCIPHGEAPPVPDTLYTGDGFLSDEPVSATPPEPGDPPCTLVMRYWAHRFGAGGSQQAHAPLTSYMVWLYSDGRLIVDTDEDIFVQWERRLTPAGVERVRQMMVRGLGEPVVKPNRNFEAAIHFGDGIFYPEDSEALRVPLLDWSWVPNKDWVTETPSIYQAAWYLTCYMKPTSHRDDVLAAVHGLPAGARDVLESRTWTPLPPDPEGWGPTSCLVLSRADAGVLAQALGRDITVGQAHVFSWPDPQPPHGFHIFALMPDGTSGAHGD
jgi:hypothetical protein